MKVADLTCVYFILEISFVSAISAAKHQRRKTAISINTCINFSWLSYFNSGFPRVYLGFLTLIVVSPRFFSWLFHVNLAFPTNRNKYPKGITFINFNRLAPIAQMGFGVCIHLGAYVN